MAADAQKTHHRPCPSTIQSRGIRTKRDEEHSQSTAGVENLSKNKKPFVSCENKRELAEVDHRDSYRSKKSKKKRSKSKKEGDSIEAAFDVIAGDFFALLGEIQLCGLDTTESRAKKSKRYSSKRASKKKKMKKHSWDDSNSLVTASTNGLDDATASFEEEPPKLVPLEFVKRPVLRSPPKKDIVKIVEPEEQEQRQTQDAATEEVEESMIQTGRWEANFLDQFGFKKIDSFGPSSSEESYGDERENMAKSPDITSQKIEEVKHLELLTLDQAMKREYIQEELEELIVLVETHTKALPDPRLCAAALLKKMRLKRKQEELHKVDKQAKELPNPSLVAESLLFKLQRERIEGKDSGTVHSECASIRDDIDPEEASPAELLLQKLERQRENNTVRRGKVKEARTLEAEKPRLPAKEEEEGADDDDDDDDDDDFEPAPLLASDMLLQKLQIRDDDDSVSTMFQAMMASIADLPDDAESHLKQEEDRTHCTSIMGDEATVDSMITGDSRDASCAYEGWDDRSTYSDPLPLMAHRNGHAWWKRTKQQQHRNPLIVQAPYLSSANSMVTEESSRGDEAGYSEMRRMIKKKEKDRLKRYYN